MPEQLVSTALPQNISQNPAQDELPSQLDQLLTEVGALAIRLKQDARWLQTAGDLPAAGHNVLRILRRFGALTVPQMARLDCTSRQNIQMIVNRLVREGCVESAPNPAHKRSGLLRLTDRGLTSLETFSRKADAHKANLLPYLAKVDLPGVTEVLRIIREGLSTIPPVESERKGLTSSMSVTRIENAAPKVRTRMGAAVRMEETSLDENELPVSLL